MAKQEEAAERIARCACGGVSVTARGEPVDVYLCSCLKCQRGTGSAFSYAALFRESAVTIAGESRQYADRGDSGRAIESDFCPTCGTAVAFRAEGLPGVSACLSVVSPIRTSLNRQSSSGRRCAITGSILPKVSR